MKNSRWLMGVVLLVMCAPAAVSAQSTAAAGASQSAQKEAAAPTPVKLEIVLSEYDGAKKISSLAYTLPVIANGDRPSGAFASLRVGVRVPVTVADEKKGETRCNINISMWARISTRESRTRTMEGISWI